MHRIASTIIFSTLILLIMSPHALAQRGGGFGGRGGFDREKMEQMRAKAETMVTPDVQWLWAVLSFDIELTDDQRPQIKAILKSTWVQKQTYIADAEKRDANWELMAEEMRDMEKRLDEQIKNILSDDQEKQLKDLKKIRDKRRNAMRPGR
jgi:hypothetical protein